MIKYKRYLELKKFLKDTGFRITTNYLDDRVGWRRRKVCIKRIDEINIDKYEDFLRENIKAIYKDDYLEDDWYWGFCVKLREVKK